MGSGLILLVIVAAWLAVLVPMALRSHEAADSLSSVDRFSDAMRVLSRRDAAARARARAVAGPARLGEGATDLDDDDPGGLDDDDLELWDDREPVLARLRAVLRRVGSGRRGRAPLTPARRRRRLLVGLLAAAALTLLAGLLVSPWLLVLQAVVDLLVVGYVVQLRRLVLARAATGRPVSRPAPARPAPARRPVPGPARRVAPPAPRSDAAAPLPAEPELGELPVAVGAEQLAAAEVEPQTCVARYDEPLPAPSIGLGAPWTPVPVPPPVYSRAPVAPRAPRTVDLTRPGAYTDSATGGERLPGMDDEAPAGRRAAERRRAVNDW